MDQLLLFIIQTTSLMVSILVTRANTSSKSMHYLCKNLFATNRVLYLIISPLEFAFTLYIHLTPIGFFPSGISTNSQILFFSIDSDSSFIAQIYFRSRNVSSILMGSESVLSAKWTKSPSSRYVRTTHNLGVLETNLFALSIFSHYLQFRLQWGLLLHYQSLKKLFSHCCNQVQLSSSQVPAAATA